MHSGEEPVGLCDTGLRAVVYCLIVFNVRFYCVRFLFSLFNSACAIKDCFVRFAHNGGHRQLQNAKLVVCRFSLRNGLIPPVQSKIASFSSLTLRSQRRRGTVSPCPPKLCFAVTGSHTLWNVSVRKVHTSALLLLTPVLLLFRCIPPYSQVSVRA